MNKFNVQFTAVNTVMLQNMAFHDQKEEDIEIKLPRLEKLGNLPRCV